MKKMYIVNYQQYWTKTPGQDVLCIMAEDAVKAMAEAVKILSRTTPLEFFKLGKVEELPGGSE